VSFPPPSATREEIHAWLAARRPKPEPAHEAPPTQGGPSPACNACGVVRIRIESVFCKGCKDVMRAAGISLPGD
jgi:hypothetical protein